MRYPKSLYAFLLLLHAHVGTVSSRPYPYRPIGVQRSQPGEVPFEVNGIDALQFYPRHANAFRRRTTGARNKGLPTRPNPCIDEDVPNLGPKGVESQLRNSDESLYKPLWAYAAFVGLLFMLCRMALSDLFKVLFVLSQHGSELGVTRTLLLGFIAIFLLAPFSLGALALVVCATVFPAYDLCNCLVAKAYGLLGMEQSKQVQVVEGDERRWSGEVIFAP